MKRNRGTNKTKRAILINEPLCFGQPYIIMLYFLSEQNPSNFDVKRSIFSPFKRNNQKDSVTLQKSVIKKGAVQQCRSTTVPKMKTLFNSAEKKTLFNSAKNLNKFQHIKCGNQKLNSTRLQSTILRLT